jgi:diguanylate cyclase (GGDEF)-like protein
LKKVRYPNDHIGSMMVWPVVCLLLILVTWVGAATKIDDSRAELEKEALARAISLSKSYSEQLARSIQQIDILTLNLKYDWEQQRATLDLSDQVRKGLYPTPSDVYLTLIDRQGVAIASTAGGAPVKVNDRSYFQFHQASPDKGLHVDPSLGIGRRSGRPVIRFSRRLETADGKFDGVVSAGVAPAFLATFNDENSMNPHDFISVRHENGTLLVSEKGRVIRGGQIHIKPPVFETDNGVMRMPKSMYRDNDARIVAWQKLPGYPLISYVGLSETDIFAEDAATAASYRQIAIAATILFICLGFTGFYYSARAARRRTKASEVHQTYQLAIDDAREGFYMVRALHSKDGKISDFIIEDCNERGASLAGHSKSSLIGMNLSSLPLPQNKDALWSFCEAMNAGFLEDEFEIVNPKPGQPKWLQRRLVRSPAGLALTLRDISDTKEHQRLLMKTANTDTLTGLPNRFWLLNNLPSTLVKLKEQSAMLAILFLDLDNFKNVNDSLGHAMGDRLLKMVAERLLALMRADDVVIRLGGDEFTVLLNAESTEEIAAVANRITSSLSQEFRILGKELSIGASIGISLYPRDGEDADLLIQKADIAMYSAKELGKNRHRFYDQQLYDGIRLRLLAEEDVARAIAVDQFEMHYQPRVDAMTGEITGLEALARWMHPTRGMVPPAEFIAIAEKTGSIVALGELIFKRVCSQIAQWQAAGERIVPVSVNLSPRQLDEGGTYQLIKSLLTEYGVSANMIEVELTETAMMSNSVDVISQVAAIRDLGIKLHLDDFGTGYSSLSRLQQIRMHVVKIDRCFTSRLGENEESNVLVNTVVLMAKALNMTVIAEGVETATQLQLLREMSCDEVQGYFISKPVPAVDIPKLIRRRFLFPESGGTAELVATGEIENSH